MDNSAAATTLQRGRLGLVAVAGLAAVVMSPSLALYFNWGPMSSDTGPVAPLVFLTALVVSVPSAISYAAVSRQLPAAGQAYTWLWRSLTPKIGTGIGILLFIYYMTSAGWDVPMYFALFFRDLMVYIGLPASAAWSAVGIVVLMGLTSLFVFREVRVNARVAVALLAFETLVVGALAITIVVKQGHAGHLSAAPFKFSSSTFGFNGFLNALIFGILSFIGYDYACVVAEEAKTPRRLMPVAVIMATCTVGLFWVLASFALSSAVPMHELSRLLASGDTPVTPIARDYWGRADILVIITGLTASLGIYVAAVPVLARVLFAMARDGVLPRRLAELNPRTRTPNVAAATVIVLALVGVFGMAAMQRSFYNTFVWYGEAAAFFALVVYIFVNIGNFAFHWRFRRSQFSWLTNFLVPLIGIAVDAYLLWRAFFKALWPTGFALGSSVVIFALCACAATIAYVLVLRARAGHVFQQASFVLADDDPAAGSSEAASAAGVAPRNVSPEGP